MNSVISKPELVLLPSRGVSILLYHRVGPPVTGTLSNLSITPQGFVEQMDWLLQNGYTALGLSALVEAACNNTLPKKPVGLTFDDAYESLISHALPVLVERRFAATIFVVTNEIGGQNRWDWPTGSGPLPLMNAMQVRDAFDAGMEIGAHSRSHPDLRQLAVSELESEICGSRDDLVDLLGSPVSSFAYPFGYFDEQALNVVTLAYRCACTTEKGLCRSNTPLHQLRRTMVRPDDSRLDFAWRVKHGRNPVEDIHIAGSRLKRRILRAFA
jgi:peptidoglycan/xylan/chitin deacetylase (PgdA/CDA1 family)